MQKDLHWEGRCWLGFAPGLKGAGCEQPPNKSSPDTATEVPPGSRRTDAGSAAASNSALHPQADGCTGLFGGRSGALPVTIRDSSVFGGVTNAR